MLRKCNLLKYYGIRIVVLVLLAGCSYEGVARLPRPTGAAANAGNDLPGPAQHTPAAMCEPGRPIEAWEWRCSCAST